MTLFSLQLWQIISKTTCTVTMFRSVLKYILSFVTLFGLIFLLRNITIGQNFRMSALYEFQNRIQSSNQSRSRLTLHDNHTLYPHWGQPLSPEEELEEGDLLDSIAWPQPPPGSAPPNLSRTSDPAHSLFTIVPSKNEQRWYVGDQLEVQVHLHDFEGRPKRYGGDFLLARLHSPKCKAGVAGQVLDHKNGLYSARFPLLWEGSAQVAVTMVHSSEAVAVLRRLREKRPDRVYFFSFFRRGNHSEKMLCNVCLPQDEGPLCNFTDPHSGDQWFCYKPKMLSCDARYSHSMGGYAKNLITEKEALLFKRHEETQPGESQKVGALYGGGQHPQHSARVPLPRPTHPHPARHGQRVALHRQRAGRPDRRSQHGGGARHLGSLQHLSRGGVHAPPPAYPQGGGATPGSGAGDGGGDPNGQPSGTGTSRQRVQQRLVDAAAGRGAAQHVQGSRRHVGGCLADVFGAPPTSQPAPS
ncbi:NXPE family member 3-like isoform X5 [Phyllopteryx taeniolatus]|uniref:NXPE family member 3-like isoform X5 n=1 Tax=Phyllopteryx taeniolatus TaxID=161469 RepID=UPI002AD2247C|nr:NXPE family member 3-like isoform X5 [Phyllopteryx taeniolatus]XP_061648941.1 NXPE family member 3-like isoform X5 [Phyllopteryx taeniolatus]